jgi:hypothetical protein
MRCHEDTCPTGIATQDATRQRGLVVPDKAERVARFQRATLHGLREMVVAMGLESPWQITPGHINERLDSARAAPIDEIYGFLEDGALLADPDATAYARSWQLAQAASFQRAA